MPHRIYHYSSSLSHSLICASVAMAPQSHQQLHFLLFPLMAQGHMIPTVDFARMLAQRGTIVTIVTTPLNSARFATILSRARESGLQIRTIELQFPFEKAGLLEGCENLDMLPSLHMTINLFTAASMLQEPVEKLFEELTPRPSCIISDMCLPWTSNIARKYQIPRISFNGFSCFCILCNHKIETSKILERISGTEYFVVPGLPHRIELTKEQLPRHLFRDFNEFVEQVREAETTTYGIIINTFQELEPEYLQEYKKAASKVWCIGPVSLCNKDNKDKVQRGNKASIDECECLKWLDNWQPGSVLYVCLGSIRNLIPSQLIELGLGLEASNKPFIWGIRGGDNSEAFKRWSSENGFEERIKGRGFLIWGWAPQVLILSHPAIGGFLTHCGWNSALEGISAGVQMLSWPLFGDQFCNEKLVVQVLRIGVRIGVEVPVMWGEEDKIGVLVKKEDVKKAVDRLMDEGEEREERRKRAKELGVMAKQAVEEEGSSQLNITLLIQDIMQLNNSPYFPTFKIRI